MKQFIHNLSQKTNIILIFTYYKNIHDKIILDDYLKYSKKVFNIKNESIYLNNIFYNTEL